MLSAMSLWLTRSLLNSIQWRWTHLQKNIEFLHQSGLSSTFIRYQLVGEGCAVLGIAILGSLVAWFIGEWAFQLLDLTWQWKDGPKLNLIFYPWSYLIGGGIGEMLLGSTVLYWKVSRLESLAEIY